MSPFRSLLLFMITNDGKLLKYAVKIDVNKLPHTGYMEKSCKDAIMKIIPEYMSQNHKIVDVMEITSVYDCESK